MLRIFQAEENAEPVEVGMADKVRFRWEGSGQPLAGSGIYELRESHAPEGLRIYGLKTPVSPSSSTFLGSDPFGISGVVQRSTYEELLLVVTHLVNMLGGAITIAPHEFVDANKLEVSAETQIDPKLFIIKTREK